MDTIGGRIRFLRKKNEMSQEQVANSIGKTKSNMSGYENDKFEPSAQTIIAICRLFSVKTDWLLLEDDSIIETDSPSIDAALINELRQLDHEVKVNLERLIKSVLFSNEEN